MNALEQLSQAIGTLASYPEHKADTEKDLKMVHEAVGELKNQLDDHAKALDTALGQFRLYLTRPASKYEFVLDPEQADASWDEIIQRGQEIQQPFWEEGEERWTQELGPSPKGPGWYGTVSMPIITIVATEPEYTFHETKRLPGRFALRSASRWGSALRFNGNGFKVIRDTVAYGHAYHEPIGIYIEPATKLPSGMIVRPFEQNIRDCLIVGSNGVLPIYLADNPDRLHIVGNNIQQHGGGFFGIKHGPAYTPDWMPEPARPNDAVYLGDTVISGNQFEGPHRMFHWGGSRKQAAIFYSGNNVQTRDNNFYGWSQCIYSHGGQGRVVTGNTAHHGDTADGRSWAAKDELVMCLLSTRGNNPDAVGMNAGGFKEWVLPKGSRVPAAGGWHNAGEVCL